MSKSAAAKKSPAAAAAARPAPAPAAAAARPADGQSKVANLKNSKMMQDMRNNMCEEDDKIKVKRGEEEKRVLLKSNRAVAKK